MFGQTLMDIPAEEWARRLAAMPVDGCPQPAIQYSGTTPEASLVALDIDWSALTAEIARGS